METTSTKILTVISTSIKTNATASDDKYNYEVDYQVSNNGKTLDNVNVNITDKNGAYAGNMNFVSSNKSISVPDNTDIAVINTMFGKIIEEINSELVKVSV
jgi:hypothetical protein